MVFSLVCSIMISFTSIILALSLALSSCLLQDDGTTAQASVTIETTSDGPDTTSVSSNQTMTIDQECERQIEPGSFLCRGIYGGEFSSICENMWCINSAHTSCLRATAPEGTPCGDQEWCVGGACVYDSSAPSANETCLFGDRKGAVFTNGWTCSDMVMNNPDQCKVASKACCHSCAPYFACLYGDKKGAVLSNGWTCSDMVSNDPQYCSTRSIACCQSCASLPTTNFYDTTSSSYMETSSDASQTSTMTSTVTSQTTSFVPPSKVPVLEFDSGASSGNVFCQLLLTIATVTTVYFIT